MPLPLDEVRARFPALADGYAYMDNAGGSLVLREVAERVSEHLLTTSVQTGASYEHSLRATARLREARARIALLLNARRPEEIVLSPSATVLCQNLARAMAPGLRPGDEIVVTGFDHESNIGPWRALEKAGLVVRTWALDRDSLVVDDAALERLDGLLGPRTRLVALTHVSNILGTINPVAALARLVRARGAQIVVDGVAFAPHRAVDVQALDVDYYVLSFYKTFGPHFAVMYGRHDRLLELDSLYHWFYGRDKVPIKLEPGNANYELAWGSAGIADYLVGLGGGGDERAAIERAFALIAEHEAALAERLLAYLRERRDVRVVGHPGSGSAERVPTISFKAPGRQAAAIVGHVDRRRVGMRHGDFHSRRLVEELGLDGDGGVLRVSLAHYNTAAEVDRLIAALDEALAA